MDTQNNYEMMPVCIHNDSCGGCIHQGKPYEQQLKEKEHDALVVMKQKEVEPEKYLPIVGSQVIYRYRNKMEYTFGDLVKDGDMTLGMHIKGKWMSIVTVDQCQLVHEDFNKVLAATLDFCKGYTKYHKKLHTGLCRHLIVRTGINTGEILITIVTSSEPGFDEEGYVKAMLDLDLEHEVVGVLRIINDGLADAVNCDEMRTLWGRPYYNETIMGLKFQVGALSFFQTNVKAVERLYNDAIESIDDYSNKTVYDLFCGTGTISQAMATKAKEVVGVEIVEEAVEMAKESAKINGIDNCTFLAGDVFDVLDNIEVKPDAIVVDPPRVGIHMKALDKILNYDIPQILYISCNYKSLFDNINYMEPRGYKLKTLRFYDNFPFTKHLEAIALLEKED